MSTGQMVQITVAGVVRAPTWSTWAQLQVRVIKPTRTVGTNAASPHSVLRDCLPSLVAGVALDPRQATFRFSP